MNITLLTFDTLDSTNTEALNHARQGADEGLCIVARQQTAGRGRHGRAWVSEKDAGLYISIILRPKIDTRFLPLITLMTGVAVHDTLQEFRIKADIKWVNDVLVDEKKICGILAEATETKTGLAVVVGVGMNIKSPNFPPEIAETATSIAELLSVRSALAGGSKELPPAPGPADLAASLTKYISYFYDILNGENGSAEIIDEWRKRSSYFSGKAVTVTLENETVSGVTDGLEPSGALRLRKDDGTLISIQAGDVQRLREDTDQYRP